MLPLLLRVTAGKAMIREARAPSQAGVHQVHPRGGLRHGTLAPAIHGGNLLLSASSPASHN